jgi:hypothetical protein
MIPVSHEKILLRSRLRYHAQNSFSLPPEITDSYIRSQFLLHKSPSFILSHLHDGTIEQYGETFNVVWRNCTPHSIKSHAQISCSFRAFHRDLEIESYVIITPLSERQIAERIARSAKECKA